MHCPPHDNSHGPWQALIERSPQVTYIPIDTLRASQASDPQETKSNSVFFVSVQGKQHLGIACKIYTSWQYTRYRVLLQGSFQPSGLGRHGATLEPPPGHPPSSPSFFTRSSSEIQGLQSCLDIFLHTLLATENPKLATGHVSFQSFRG